MRRYGDNWDYDAVRNVFAVAMVGTAVPAVILFFFDDLKTLGRVSQAHIVPVQEGDEGGPQRLAESSPLINTATGYGTDTGSSESEQTACTCTTRVIPWCLACSDLAFCFGQGMTVKYFSVYFENKVGKFCKRAHSSCLNVLWHRPVFYKAP